MKNLLGEIGCEIFLTYLFVVDLSITDSYCDCLIELHTDLMINLLHSPRNETSLFEVVGKPQHGERLSRSSLPVAHDGSVVTCYHIRHCLRRCKVIHISLRGIEHDLVEFELPVFELVVDGAMVLFVTPDFEVL